MKEYVEAFLTSQYGKEKAVEVLETIQIIAVENYDSGGVSEATEQHIKIAAKRDIDAGKLTDTTKLIIRHELGHIFDENSPDFPEFEEEIQHEKIAWAKAKPRNAAENWYKNVSIRTHLDPLKMMSIGFPSPETKISQEQLKRGIFLEVKRMKKNISWVDEVLAERYAMANLVENPYFYNSP